MTKENQIEEIVRDVDKAIRANFAWDVLAGGYVVNKADNIAQELYYADYRKIYDDIQRQCPCYALGCQMAESLKKDVAREIFEEIEDAYYECIHINPTTNIGHLLQTKFLTKLAELKEKHIGEDTNVLTNTEGEE